MKHDCTSSIVLLPGWQHLGGCAGVAVASGTECSNTWNIKFSNNITDLLYFIVIYYKHFHHCGSLCCGGSAGHFFQSPVLCWVTSSSPGFPISPLCGDWSVGRCTFLGIVGLFTSPALSCVGWIALLWASPFHYSVGITRWGRVFSREYFYKYICFMTTWYFMCN